MKKTIPKLLTLVCLLVAVMGLSVVTAHAATVTGTVSSGNEYRYHEDKTPVSQWGPYTSNKLKYFTRNDTGETVPAYCMEPEVRSASGDLQYSSTSWSDLTWNQRYAVTLAMAYGYGGNYGFNMHPDCAQLATQAVVWEFVCGYRSPVYPYTLYDTTCANLFHYAGDDVAVAYNIIIDRIMNHGKIPSFAVKYRNQLSDANAITLTWDGSKYTGTATDTNGVLPQYYFCLALMAYAVIKVFFANLKRGGILLIQIAVGSLYMFSVPRGYGDGFIQWCKQVVGLCLTTFLQATILVAGLMVFKDHALLGLGLMLSAGEIPRIAGAFGLDTTTRANISSAVYTAQSAVSMARTVVAAAK